MCIRDREATDQWFSLTSDQFQGFRGLDQSNDAWQNTKDTSFSTARRGAWRRWLGKKAAVAWTTEARCENARLAFKTEDRSVDVRLARKDADIIGKIARRKIIGPIDNNIIGGDHLLGVLARKSTI